MPDTTALPLVPIRVVLPAFGHRRTAWSVHGLTSLMLALHGQAGGLRFSQGRERGGWATVEGLWGWPEELFATSGRNALLVREHRPGNYFDLSPSVFDDEFAVRGEPAERARRYFDSETRLRLLELARLAGPFLRPRRVRLSVARGRASLTLWRYLGRNAALLDRFLDRAVAILGRLQELPEHRLEIVTACEAAGGARCPVCGEEMRGQVAQCDRCRTVHHEECFRYVGSCARFACGCRTTRPARVEK